MDISCDIIRDLLPLYAEDLVSEDSKKMVDEHLCECDPCAKQLAILKKAAQVPVEVNVDSLIRVEKTIRRRKVLTVICAIMVIVSILASFAAYLTVPVALTAEEVDLKMELVEYWGEPALKATYRPNCSMEWSHVWEGDNDGYVLAASSRLEYLRSKYIVQEKYPEEYSLIFGVDPILNSQDEAANFLPNHTNANGEEHIALESNHWYLNIYDGTAQTLLYDAGKEAPTEPLADATNELLAYFLYCTALSLILAAVSRVFKNTWREMIQRVAILLGALAASTLIVTGGRFVCLEIGTELFFRKQNIIMLSIVLALTGMFCLRLYKLNQQDKGL